MTDIIQRAEQWLASIDGDVLFDSLGAEPLKDAPELVRALVARLKQMTRDGVYLVGKIAEIDQQRLTLLAFNQSLQALLEPRIGFDVDHEGINDAWPGNPGEGD